jgi:hypothetical protein
MTNLSKAQNRFMQAAASSPKMAKELGIFQKVAKEFVKETKSSMKGQTRKGKKQGVIIFDDFLPNAEEVAAEFPAFESDAWFEYNNPIEVKKTCNNWHHFGPETYKTFQYLLSKDASQRN